MSDLLTFAIVAISATVLSYTVGCMIGYYIGLGAVGDQYQRMRREARDVFAVTDRVHHLRVSLRELEQVVDLLARYQAQVQANKYRACDPLKSALEELKAAVTMAAAAAAGKNAQELAYLARDPLALEMALLDVRWSIESLAGVIERRLYSELNGSKDYVARKTLTGIHAYGKNL
jgi:hypothetical protein